MDLQPIRNGIESVHKIMAEREYAISTIKGHRSVLNSLLKFMKENNFTELNEEIAITFVKQKTGMEMDGFWGRFDRKTNTVLKPVQNVLYYVVSLLKKFGCPHPLL